MKKKIAILDVWLSAYLILHSQQPEIIKQGSRVIFEFPATQKFFNLSKTFNSNPAIPVLDYVKAVRQLKAKMFSMKTE